MAVGGTSPFAGYASGEHGGYDPEKLAKLTAMGGQAESAPSGSPDPAASQGALEDPAAAGTPSSGGALGGESGAEAGESYYDFHKDASEADKTHATNEMDRNLGMQGSGVIAKASEFVEEAMRSGNQEALALAERYGWKPKGSLDKKGAETEGWDRNAMGGFLTEMGLRMIASDKEGIQGVAQGALDTQAAGVARKDKAEAKALADADAERARRREDVSDTQQARKMELAEEKAARDKLEKITDKDGKVTYVDIEKGTVTDENGEPIREATAADLSAAQQRTRSDNYNRALVGQANDIRDELKDSKRQFLKDHPEFEGVTGKAKEQLINKMAQERLDGLGYVNPSSGGAVIDYSSL